MIILPLQTFRAFVSKPMPVARPMLGALDVGTRNIGVSGCALGSHLVAPLGDIEITLAMREEGLHEKLARKIQKTVDEKHIVGLVVGFPLGLQEEVTPLCEHIVQLVSNLPVHFPGHPAQPLPCTFWDERNSSVGARAMAKSISSRKAVAKKYKDAFAACLILRGFLEYVPR